MLKFISLALLFLLLISSAKAELEFDHYAWLSIGSKHTGVDVEYEEFNPGIGIQSFLQDTPFFLAAGAFDNSFDSRHSKEEFGNTSDITYFAGMGLEYQGKYLGPGYVVGVATGYPFPLFVTPYIRLGSREWIIQTQISVLPLNLISESDPNVYGLSFTINLAKIGKIFK